MKKRKFKSWVRVVITVMLVGYAVFLSKFCVGDIPAQVVLVLVVGVGIYLANSSWIEFEEEDKDERQV